MMTFGSNDWSDAQRKMALDHYKTFLFETAKTLGMNQEELAKIEGFRSPEEVNKCIDSLVEKHGMNYTRIHDHANKYIDSKMNTTRPYDEWETL